jgi:GTP-dependent phosphoenolpyruvate carboxykinase
LALEKVIRSLPVRQNMEIMEQNTILAYADDIVIIDSSRIDVETRTADLIKAAEPIGLKVNQEKTKYLAVSREERTVDDMLVDGYVF